MTCCDHGYGRPSWRPRVTAPATYRSGTPRNQHPAVARWHTHLRGLATAIHEISGLRNRGNWLNRELTGTKVSIQGHGRTGKQAHGFLFRVRGLAETRGFFTEPRSRP